MSALSPKTKLLTRNESLILLLVEASRRWKRPPDYVFIFNETGYRKADVLRLIQRVEK